VNQTLAEILDAPLKRENLNGLGVKEQLDKTGLLIDVAGDLFAKTVPHARLNGE
jgi:hypothetical protein